MRVATEKQISFLRTLIEERSPEEIQEKQLQWLEQGPSIRAASDAIEKLLARPKLNSAKRKLPEGVEPGRYAVTLDGVLRFYKITKRGWMGRKSSDLTLPIPLGERQKALTEIAKDARAASIRYGHEFGQCGVCGRGLTDPESREAGIGPVCAGKRGW